MSESQVGARVWTQAVDHGFSIIFDLAMGGNYPNGVCGLHHSDGTHHVWGHDERGPRWGLPALTRAGPGGSAAT